MCLAKTSDHKWVTALSPDIAGMDALSLNYWWSKFVMEVAKKVRWNPPNTVYGIICSLKRCLEKKNGSEALNPLGRVVRKSVNANPGLKVNRGNNFSCKKVLSIAYVLCTLRLLMLRTEGQKI